MMKAMCFSGMIFGVLALLVFGFDLTLKFPFGRPSATLDIGFIILGMILIYLGWAAKEVVD